MFLCFISFFVLVWFFVFCLFICDVVGFVVCLFVCFFLRLRSEKKKTISKKVKKKEQANEHPAEEEKTGEINKLKASAI